MMDFKLEETGEKEEKFIDYILLTASCFTYLTTF